MTWGGWQGAGALSLGGQECLEALIAVGTTEMLRV